MPYSAKDATRFTKKATTAKKKRQFAHVANSALKRGSSEASAIRQANAAVAGTTRRGNMPAGIGYSSSHGKRMGAVKGSKVGSKHRGGKPLATPFSAASTVSSKPSGSKAPKKDSGKRRA